MKERSAELGLTQRALAKRSGVSLSVVRELLGNTEQRRRHPRTLEALSEALELHPQYLTAVMLGRPLPADPAEEPDHGRLSAVEHQLSLLTETVSTLSANISTLTQRIDSAWPNATRRR